MTISTPCGPTPTKRTPATLSPGRMTLGAAPLTLTRALSPITPLMVMLVCAPAVPTTNRHNAANDFNISHLSMKPIAIFRHAPTEGPGHFATYLDAHGLPWRLIAIDAGDSVPPALPPSPA